MSPLLTQDELLRVYALYPAIASLPGSLRRQVLVDLGPVLDVPSGTLLFDEGQPCQGFPLLLSGCVRIARGSPQGRRLEMYRVQPGELCVVSASCLLGHAPLSAHGQATERTELLLLRQEGFDLWCGDAQFRALVFGVFAQRMTDLMALAEAVSFHRLDQRLAQALLGHGPQRQVTHQVLADELGTVREIVSRLLNRFERSGWVKLGRERIKLVDPVALRLLSQGEQPPGS